MQVTIIVPARQATIAYLMGRRLPSSLTATHPIPSENTRGTGSSWKVRRMKPGKHAGHSLLPTLGSADGAPMNQETSHAACQPVRGVTKAAKHSIGKAGTDILPHTRQAVRILFIIHVRSTRFRARCLRVLSFGSRYPLLVVEARGGHPSDDNITASFLDRTQLLLASSPQPRLLLPFQQRHLWLYRVFSNGKPGGPERPGPSPRAPHEAEHPRQLS